MKSTIDCSNGKLLTNYVLKRILHRGVSAMNISNHVMLPAKIKINKLLDVPYIRVYVRF